MITNLRQIIQDHNKLIFQSFYLSSIKEYPTLSKRVRGLERMDFQFNSILR